MKELSRELQKIQQQIITSGQKNISKKSEGNKKQENLESQSLINCSICDDLYWVAPANQETISANYILCECVKDKVISRQKESMTSSQDLGDLTPSMLKKMTFGTFKTNQQDSNLSEALEISKAYFENPDGWLLFTGPTGVGKTHLSVAIAEKRIKSLKPVYFGFIPNILEKLRNFNNRDNQTEGYLAFLIECPFLIIDDLGSQVNSNWAEEKIYQIIVNRHNNGLPTIITTRASNISEQLVFNPQISEAIQSRLQDTKMVNEFAIVSQDYRNRN
ncbi:MAG: hypothetical protein CMP17_05450 [Rickettsiales bacterium]|nr:hypothetical protein [Chloroflexota bacterium]MBE32387.1 hypothetical protein [Rickettsiales bacterium]